MGPLKFQIHLQKLSCFVVRAQPLTRDWLMPKRGRIICPC